jgi:hypothetical protein
VSSSRYVEVVKRQKKKREKEEKSEIKVLAR